MQYKFNKVILHNFLSFGDAEINLRDKGYCLIRGENKNPSDRASSNGSGKSTIISAISYCLTGQTIQGVKSNIENIHTTGGAFVTLDFNVDNDHYIVTRYKNHQKYKTDLKIFKNNEDISGKGITESSKILAQHLPELTSQLLSSVILLGQGLPNSFTKNSPSGRKELLEQLTGSDFMIQDVKRRIGARLDKLNNDKRKFDDEILSANSKLDVYNNELQKTQDKIDNYVVVDYDLKIENTQKAIDEINSSISSLNQSINNLTQNKDELSKQINDNKVKLAIIENNIRDKYSTELSNFVSAISNKNNEIIMLRKDINQKDSIKDVCSLCGQKLIGVTKPDTTLLKIDLQNKMQEYNKLVDEETKLKDKIRQETNLQQEEITKQITIDEQELKNIINQINTTNVLLTNNSREISNLKIELQNLQNKKENSENELNNLKLHLDEINDNIKGLNEKLLYNNVELEKLQEHINIVTKMDTLVKRDFRGYLLSNIIDYVQRKSQEYCEYIFNSNELQIQLNGNDIDIIFCGKEFESLSGGEKQKVDVIIQFAIRDMMSKYLDFKSNILFLDEITDNLDSVGCEGLFNLVSNTLNDLESIFIISHHSSELEIPLDNEIVVVKNMNGISEIV